MTLPTETAANSMHPEAISVHLQRCLNKPLDQPHLARGRHRNNKNYGSSAVERPQTQKLREKKNDTTETYVADKEQR